MRETKEDRKDGYFVGIDGGGTKTTIAVAGKDGKPLTVLNSGPTRLASVGPEETRERLARGLEEALAEAEIPKSQLAAVGWGVGGLDTEGDRREAKELIGEILPTDLPTRIEDDAIVGLFSGTFGAPGVSIVAGTGSLIAGIGPDSERARVDGWGYLFGDLGSAYYVGRRAVMAVLESYDGRGEETELTGLVLDRLGLNSPDELLDHFYPPKNAPREVARLSATTDRAAATGDHIAREILNDAADELIRSAETLIDRLSLLDMGRIPVVLVGGVFNSTRVRLKVEESLKSLDEGIESIRPDWPPVVGALIAGMKEVDEEVGTETQRNLKEVRNPAHGSGV